jgi:hypothetical protein
VLGATSAEDNDSSFSETEEETEEVAALKNSNLISNDILPEPTNTPVTSLQIPTMPAFPTHTPLISRQIPVFHSQTTAAKQRKIQYFKSQQRLINHFTTESSL